jgi:capsular polysaccharide biosynthesis protein
MYNSQLNSERGPASRAPEPEPGISAKPTEGGHGISLRNLLQAVRRQIWLIVVITGVLVGATVGLSMVLTPKYEASLRIMVGQYGGVTNNPSDVVGLQQLTQTMTEAVSSRSVAYAVIQQQDLQMTPEELLKNLSAEQIRATQLIEVKYRDPSPQRAQLVANAVGDVFSRRISEGIDTADDTVTATVWERAELPDEPVSPNLLRNGALALILGVLLGTALAFLLEYRDSSRRSPEEAEQISGAREPSVAEHNKKG